MSDPRWTDETETHIADAFRRCDPYASTQPDDYHRLNARAVLKYLADTGLLVQPELRDAVRRLGHGLVAVSHLLDKPYPDAPKLTPWTRFVHPQILEVRRLVGLERQPATREAPHA